MACSLRQAQRRAEVAEQRAETSETQTRPMTLDEYIAACHTFLFSRLSIETDPKLALRGSIIRSALRIVSHRTPVFENRDFLADLGNRIAQRPIADEKTLESFLYDKLKQEEEVRRSFQIGDGVIFENHLHALSDVAEGAIERKTQSTPPRTPDHRRDLKQLRPDQICVYRSDNTASSRRTMLCISEYKPPHKLSSQHLRAGLRITDIHEEVVNRRTIPTSMDPDAGFQYHAEKLTASAVAQTYHYMIESGLEYGLLTTGEAIIARSGGDSPSKQPTNVHGCRSISSVHPHGSRFAWRTAGDLAGGAHEIYGEFEEIQ
ncbi:hypothetical protein IWW34DRAFT_899133 [Fusarium oxysporum f. sp. albedinis]|nr:hypothetical protein IWW34DRAFT_899133 [Fusarium oxysporum f. sp. albedinis]